MWPSALRAPLQNLPRESDGDATTATTKQTRRRATRRRTNDDGDNNDYRHSRPLWGTRGKPRLTAAAGDGVASPYPYYYYYYYYY